jgi:hypothetical protein
MEGGIASARSGFCHPRRRFGKALKQLITPVQAKPMHRKELIQQLCSIYSQRQNLLLVGVAGIGKTTLLREVGQTLPLQICQETSSLSRICDGLEHQLDWSHEKLNIIQRKNRLLTYLEGRRESVAFDHVAKTPPRVGRFIAHLTEKVPVWIACRSDHRREIGHVWEYLYKFTRLEVPPLTLVETSAIIANAIESGTIQPDAYQHRTELHRISKGVPRVIEELLVELAARNYKMDGSFGLHLLELDRQIRGLSAATSKIPQ